jgi:hypothetical protein
MVFLTVAEWYIPIRIAILFLDLVAISSALSVRQAIHVEEFVTNVLEYSIHVILAGNIQTFVGTSAMKYVMANEHYTQ